MGSEALDILDRLVGILRSGGPWAVAAIFILMWWRADRYARSLASELKDLAVANIEGSVENRMTLEALKDGIEAVENTQSDVKTTLERINGALNGILAWKEKRLPPPK